VEDTFVLVKYSLCLWNAKLIISFDKNVYIRKEFRESEQFFGTYFTFIVGLDISRSRALDAIQKIRERAFKGENFQLMDDN
jgi:hypothetical protein